MAMTTGSLPPLLPGGRWNQAGIDLPLNGIETASILWSASLA
jgi:hypothetical protein